MSFGPGTQAPVGAEVAVGVGVVCTQRRMRGLFIGRILIGLRGSID